MTKTYRSFGLILPLILIFTGFPCFSLVADETPSEGAVIINQVPSYYWYHGCLPSAGGSIVGYWDLHGYDNLLPASGWDEVRLTDNVAEQLSSTAHNIHYDGTDLPPPAPPATSLADFFQTSVDPALYGDSPVSFSTSGIPSYAAYRGHNFSSIDMFIGQVDWEDFKAEIDSGRPMLSMVNSDGGSLFGNHFIPIIGYDENCNNIPGLKCYAAYLNQTIGPGSADENEIVHWKLFQSSFLGQWGISQVFFIRPLDAPEAKLEHVVRILQILSGLSGDLGNHPYLPTPDGDEKASLEDIISILREIAGLP